MRIFSDENEPKYDQKLREEVTAARELLDFAISEGHMVNDKIIADINRIDERLRDTDTPASQPVDLSFRISFEKAYRDLVKSLEPVTRDSLRFSAILKRLVFLLPFGFFFILLFCRHYWFTTLEPLILFVIIVSLTFFIWFLYLFTGVIRKKRVIEIVLFCYLFTILAILFSILPFLLSSFGWNFESTNYFMQKSPIGIVKGCNKQVDQKWVPKELQCNNDKKEWLGIPQWVINIGGTIEGPCATSSSAIVAIDNAAVAGANATRLNAAAAGVLAQGDWIWIQGNTGHEEAQADLVRITDPVAAGEDVRINPALSSPHDAGREVRRATIAPVGTIDNKAVAEANAIRLNVAAAAVLAQGDWIWIQGNTGHEEAQADLVRITDPVAAGEDVRINPALSSPHDAGREVRRATIALATQMSLVICGGLVVPLYVVFLSLIGGAVSMTRRVPEYQRRIYLPEGTDEHLPRESARELLVLQIMQVLSAPMIAITAYYMVKPDNLTMSVVIGFASGFASETILRAIHALIEKLNPAEPRPSIPAAQPAVTVSGIQPNQGLAGSTVPNINVVGTGFQARATVRLVQGTNEIKADDVNVVQRTRITCKFKLPEAGPAGKWDVVVTNPDQHTGTLPDGFEITQQKSTNTAIGGGL